MSAISKPSLVARLTLARPSLELLPSYLEFIDEMRALDETVWSSRVPDAREVPDAFVARLLRKEIAPDPPAVPESVHWGVVDGVVVGLIALRHELNRALAQFGGHVGYEVRPSFRRRGVATAMLGLVLTTDRARAMGRILVTCAPTHVASRKVIEANGGVLVGTIFADAVKRETCHYWIDL